MNCFISVEPWPAGTKANSASGLATFIISASTRQSAKAARRCSFSASKPMLVQTSVVTRSAPRQASIGSLKTL